jgi:hypothetical protein
MKTINPASSPHAEAAKVLIDKIRSLREEIPRFVPEEKSLTPVLARRGRVPDVGLELASVAIQRSPRLEIAAGSDAASLRDSFAFALAYMSVAKELQAMARGVLHTIRLERARAGMSALDIYAVARRLSKQADGVELAPFVEDMAKLLKHKQPRKTNSTSDSAPALTPTPPQK